MNKAFLQVLTLTLLSGFSMAIVAAPPLDAEIISLKRNCSGDANCFSDPATMLNWIWGTRNPTATAPLLVEIAPGAWSWPSGYTCSINAPFVSATRGHVTFKGSGPDNTRLQLSFGSLFGMQIAGCQNLSFQDLSISGPQYAIFWEGGGNSRWTNVASFGTLGAWYDTVSSASSCPGRHDWFSSTLHATYGNTFFSRCGDSWFWGSELRAVNSPGNNVSSAILTDSSTGQIHLYGSNVRVVNTGTASSVSGLVARSGGVIHIHGGEVTVRAENPAVNTGVIGAVSDGAGSLVHTHMTSFGVLPSGAGLATRLMTVNGGKVESPFTWTAGVLAPTPGDSTGSKHIVSLDGQDTFTETDCPINAGCQTSGSYPHVMVYSSACSGAGASKGPWFDQTTNKCRGE